MTEEDMTWKEYLIILEQPNVVWAWERFGGSFVKGLAQALMHADPINTKKIHDTWPEYWKEGLDQYIRTHTTKESK